MSDDATQLNSSLQKIAKGTGIGFTGILVGIFFDYFFRIIIARWLGASNYGLITLGFAIMSIAVVISLVGLKQGIIRHVSYYKGKDNEERIKGTIIDGVTISIPLSLILMIIVFHSTEWISLHIFKEENLMPVLNIFAVAIPFWVLTQVFIAGTIGFQDLRYQVYVNSLFQNIFKLIATIFFLFLGFGVIGAAWGWVLAILLMPFLAFYFLETRAFSVLNNKIKSISDKKELFSFSLPLVFVGVAIMLTGWTDTLMLGYFSTAREVGIYNAAHPTAKLLRVFLTSFGAIFMPVASELYSRNYLTHLRYTYSAVTKWVFSLVIPVFLLMVLFSEWILRTLFGSEFIEAKNALSILAFGYLILCIVGPTSQILQAFGRTKSLMSFSFFGAGSNVIFNYLLIPIYGVMGAAIATGTSIAIMNILHLIFVHRITGMQPFRVVYIKPLVASVLAVLVVYSITKYLIGISLLSVVPILIIFFLIYFLLLLIFKSFIGHRLSSPFIHQSFPVDVGV